MNLSELPWWLSVAAGAGSIMLAWVVSSLLGGPRRRRQAESPPLVMTPRLEGAKSLDDAATRILEQVTTWVRGGRAFHAYWLDREGASWHLRATLAKPSYPDVVPDYSGLVLEGSAAVPLAIAFESQLVAPRVRGPRDERWLDLPVGRDLLITVLLTPNRRFSPSETKRLTDACEAYAPLATAVRRWLEVREEMAHYRSLLDSTRIALDVTLHTDRAIRLLMNVGAQAVGASVQVAVIEGPEEPIVIAETADGRSIGEQIIQGIESRLTVLPPQPDVVPGIRMPAFGSRYNACVRIPVFVGGKEPLGCFYYFTKHAPALNSYQTAVMRALGERTAQLLSSRRQMQSASNGYVETLRVMVNAMDGLSPHGQGHSERMSRLAALIARQLGVPDREVDAIALAAFYHDVGMVAVDPEVILKPQKLTETEYEKVKSHAELGGQLMAAVPASLSLAEIVAGHHERWDGFGYPRGLKGVEIPLGARILAVADLLEAKTTGRSYRPPVGFLQALEDVKSASGNHLDPQVVEALIAAYAGQRVAVVSDLPLSPCWDMRCIPEAVCSGCPNRKPQATRCWEAPGNLCSRHGDRCPECLVYTEASSRKMPAGAGGAVAGMVGMMRP